MSSIKYCSSGYTVGCVFWLRHLDKLKSTSQMRKNNKNWCQNYSLHVQYPKSKNQREIGQKSSKVGGASVLIINYVYKSFKEYGLKVPLELGYNVQF